MSRENVREKTWYFTILSILYLIFTGVVWWWIIFSQGKLAGKGWPEYLESFLLIAAINFFPYLIYVYYAGSWESLKTPTRDEAEARR